MSLYFPFYQGVPKAETAKAPQNAHPARCVPTRFYLNLICFFKDSHVLYQVFDQYRILLSLFCYIIYLFSALVTFMSFKSAALRNIAVKPIIFFVRKNEHHN